MGDKQVKRQFGLSGLRVRAVLATVLIMPALLMGCHGVRRRPNSAATAGHRG